jgi:hypothetical protein
LVRETVGPLARAPDLFRDRSERPVVDPRILAVTERASMEADAEAGTVTAGVTVFVLAAI